MKPIKKPIPKPLFITIEIKNLDKMKSRLMQAIGLIERLNEEIEEINKIELVAEISSEKKHEDFR